jgi:hypothetical protein
MRFDEERKKSEKLQIVIKYFAFGYHPHAILAAFESFCLAPGPLVVGGGFGALAVVCDGPLSPWAPRAVENADVQRFIVLDGDGPRARQPKHGTLHTNRPVDAADLRPLAPGSRPDLADSKAHQRAGTRDHPDLQKEMPPPPMGSRHVPPAEGGAR